MPPVHVQRIRFSPPLPSGRRHLQQRNSMGAIIKSILLFKTGSSRRLASDSS